MSTKIPYIISEAHPDYKRPWLNQEFGSINETLKDTFFIEKITEFICSRISSNNIVSVDCIQKFWENFYDDTYMCNLPWEAKIFINEKWVSVCPTNIEIFEYIQELKSGDNAEEKMNCDDDDEEYIDYEFTEEDIKIQNEMKQYIDTELDAPDLEVLTSLSDIEQIIYILNKCILNISSDKYNSNREIFYKFFNIISKCTQKDIDKTIEKMKNNDNEKLRLKMNNLMNLHSSLLEYKKVYHNLNP